MAVARHFSIRVLMVLIGLVAADFAIVRGLLGSRFMISPATAIATLPMVNLLILTSPRLRMGSSTSRYWVGFHGVGWSMVLVICLLGGLDRGAFYAPIGLIEGTTNPSDWRNRNTSPLHGLRRRNGNTGNPVVQVLLILTIYSAPQFPVAFLAGRLANKNRAASASHLDRREPGVHQPKMPGA